MNNEEKLVEVYRSKSDMEAQVIKSLLDSYEIPSMLKGNAAASVHMFTIDGMGETSVMVREADEERARQLISGGEANV